MTKKKGSLSINSENIFPIIKKWMYSDHDIFFRELISNGCDAITKLKKLDMMGEYEFSDDHKSSIQVIVNPKEKTLKFIDTGLGMTADEVEEYITQIAFSGATDFLDKYKDKTNEEQIIGHFGLGFYSAFMVADYVHIDTLSYKDGAQAVHWECDGGTEYELSEGSKEHHGTEITLFLNEESLEFANEYRAREVIQKYCSFMPVEIFLSKDDSTEPEEELSSLSDTTPLWTKHPNECSKEDYIEFYKKVFMDFKEPLFWIHLNMDYPFNLKGILYFPRINSEYENIEGTIKLYNNQVFIADNIKEVIPEYLLLLKGVIDCPDLPLNVSRSALQNDGFVNKISEYISKKVADKLTGMCKVDRENYETYWSDISPFIKFGCLKDTKFCDKMSDYILFENLEGSFLSLNEYSSKLNIALNQETSSEEDNSEDTQEKSSIYYVTDKQQQAQYINMFNDNNLDAIMLTHNIDNAFISQLEQRNNGIKFERIDTDLTDILKENISSEEETTLNENSNTLTELFKNKLNNESLSVKVERLKSENIASMMTSSEDARRMQEMMKQYGMAGMDPNMMGNDLTLVLNQNHKLVQFLLNTPNSEHSSLLCKQLYDLALMANKQLGADAMVEFINRSNEIMMLLV